MLVLPTTPLGQEYKLLFEGAGSNPGDKTLEDRFFEHEVGSRPVTERDWWLRPDSAVTATCTLCLPLSTGETEQVGLPEPVSLWCLLRLCEAQGAGVSQHCMDCRVYRPASPRQDRQLYPHLLVPWHKAPHKYVCLCAVTKAIAHLPVLGVAHCPSGCPASMTLCSWA